MAGVQSSGGLSAAYRYISSNNDVAVSVNAIQVSQIQRDRPSGCINFVRQAGLFGFLIRVVVLLHAEGVIS